MKTAGVIVEYNPFHNGHYYHIQETKKVTGADIIVAVMSGNFLQRGEPALVSKWARTKMALQGGADIVIELPYVFATQKAEIFAYGAVAILDALNIDSLCFGSEDGNIESFKNTIKLMEEHETSFNDTIRKSLQQGKSYPRSAADAFLSLHQDQSCVDLSQPNNILGYHYIKAIHKLNSTITPHTINRTKANYHDQDIHDPKIASATSIRKILFADQQDLESIMNVIPRTSFDSIIEYKKEFKIFHNWERYFPLLKYRLLSTTPSELRKIYEVEEGIENRLIKYIRASKSFEDFMKKIKTKRYTWTRLQRICLHILTNTLKDSMIENVAAPTYLRLLGMSNRGQNYLNKIKKNIEIPIISRLSAFSNSQISFDINATQVYSCCLDEPYQTKMIESEFSNTPIRYANDEQLFI
ncbi:nucleotidyltransferase [Bacillus sp. Marseille-P3661]|uniref:nucleotidyltransferase n=1 Tax=Bacillus sp. Marseille-P3661 TaxID=1936234 RepID=UPI000C846243|nr:nucleotidyltransferase [Bacillus sp. Marseille-P3661]